MSSLQQILQALEYFTTNITGTGVLYNKYYRHWSTLQQIFQALEYFITNEWEWTNERTVSLQKELSEAE